MARDDSSLYSGITSSSRLKAERRAREAEKEAKKTLVKPVEALLYELIDKEEKATILTILGTVDVTTDKEQVKETLLALQLYKQSLQGFRAKLNNIIRKERRDDE